MVSPPLFPPDFRWHRTVAFFSGLLALVPVVAFIGIGLRLSPGYVGTVALLALALAGWMVLLRRIAPLLDHLAHRFHRP